MEFPTKKYDMTCFMLDIVTYALVIPLAAVVVGSLGYAMYMAFAIT